MRSAPCATDLGTRSDGRDLPARSGPLQFLPLLDTEARAATWRVVEAFSTAGLPFELDLAWSSGGGMGASAKVTVSRATRICVFARGLRVQAANLAVAPNRVGITVSDAQACTENQWEAVGENARHQPALDVPVPSFAKRVRLEMQDAGSTQGSTPALRIWDGTNTIRSTVPLDAQPPDGVPVGGALRVSVLAGPAIPWRVVFTLSL